MEKLWKLEQRLKSQERKVEWAGEGGRISGKVLKVVTKKGTVIHVSEVYSTLYVSTGQYSQLYQIASFDSYMDCANFINTK